MMMRPELCKLPHFMEKSGRIIREIVCTKRVTEQNDEISVEKGNYTVIRTPGSGPE
jgi:hypothetical protein